MQHPQDREGTARAAVQVASAHEQAAARAEQVSSTPLIARKLTDINAELQAKLKALSDMQHTQDTESNTLSCTNQRLVTRQMNVVLRTRP
jgi:hypothetical protein